jgi:hypothetical protein
MGEKNLDSYNDLTGEWVIQPTISLEMPVPSQGHYGFQQINLYKDSQNMTFILFTSFIVKRYVIIFYPVHRDPRE